MNDEPRTRRQNPTASLGPLLESFVNAVSHPRGRALAFLAKAHVTVDQAIVLNAALTRPDSTASSLAAVMNLSLPSVSQMIERLVKQGLVRRVEHPGDRRKRTIEPTAKAKTFLSRFKAVRIDECETATASLSSATRRKLADALTVTLDELARANAMPSSPRSP